MGLPPMLIMYDDEIFFSPRSLVRSGWVASGGGAKGVQSSCQRAAEATFVTPRRKILPFPEFSLSLSSSTPPPQDNYGLSNKTPRQKNPTFAVTQSSIRGKQDRQYGPISLRMILRVVQDFEMHLSRQCS